MKRNTHLACTAIAAIASCAITGTSIRTASSTAPRVQLVILPGPPLGLAAPGDGRAYFIWQRLGPNPISLSAITLPARSGVRARISTTIPLSTTVGPYTSIGVDPSARMAILPTPVEPTLLVDLARGHVSGHAPLQGAGSAIIAPPLHRALLTDRAADNINAMWLVDMGTGRAKRIRTTADQTVAVYNAATRRFAVIDVPASPSGIPTTTFPTYTVVDAVTGASYPVPAHHSPLASTVSAAVLTPLLGSSAHGRNDIVGLDTARAVVAWDAPVAGVESSVALDQVMGRVYVQAAGGYLAVLDARTGRLVARARFAPQGAPTDWAPISYHGRVWALALSVQGRTAHATFVALDARTLRPVRQIALPYTPTEAVLDGRTGTIVTIGGVQLFTSARSQVKPPLPVILIDAR